MDDVVIVIQKDDHSDDVAFIDPDLINSLE